MCELSHRSDFFRAADADGQWPRFSFPLWIAGLCWLFFGREGRKYRVLGWAFIAITFVLTAYHARQGLLPCACLSHALYAAAASICESWVEKRSGLNWLKPAFTSTFAGPDFSGIAAYLCAGH